MPSLDPEAIPVRAAPPSPPSPRRGEGYNNSGAASAAHSNPLAPPSLYPLPKGAGGKGNNNEFAEDHAIESSLAAWAAVHVGQPWNATCRAALGWLDHRALALEEAVVATPMTPFGGDYRCVAPVIGAFTPMALPGNGRLVTLILHPEPVEGGRRRAIFRAYVEGTREGHFVSLDPLPCDGPMAHEAGRAIADGRFDALPGIINAHLPSLGHAPAAWVKIADLRFFAAFQRSVQGYADTGDLWKFVRDTLLAIECVYRERWIAFAPEPPCFSRLRGIAEMARPLVGKAWDSAEVVAHATPSPLTPSLRSGQALPSPPAGAKTSPGKAKDDRVETRLAGLPFDSPACGRLAQGGRGTRTVALPRLCLAILARDGAVSAVWFDPANPLHLTPPYDAVRSCHGVPFHRLARAMARATGADWVEAVRQDVLLRIAGPLVGRRGRGDLAACLAAVSAWVFARLRYGRDVVSWPGPLPPRILPLLARVALSNVR